jgi:hypothetical protein
MKQKFSQSVLPRVLQVFSNFFKFFSACGKRHFFGVFYHNILGFSAHKTPCKCSTLRTLSILNYARTTRTREKIEYVTEPKFFIYAHFSFAFLIKVML